MRSFTAPRDEAERQELLDYAGDLLGSGLPVFLATGDLPSTLLAGEGSFGDLREARSHSFDRSAVALYAPCLEEVETARAWHEYCESNGYPIGALCGADDAPGSNYPPKPSHGGGQCIGMKWPAVRKALLTAEEEVPQLAMELAA